MNADRNLTFGILALQMDFISRDQLVEAMNDWVSDKSRSLEEVLLENNAIQEDVSSLLDALVAKHLEAHDNDPEKSLASVSSLGSVRQDLQQIGDDEVTASLVMVPMSREASPHSTNPETFGEASDSVGGSSSGGTRFKILRPHAEGGLGVVNVALDGELNREVALKEIRETLADNPTNRGRFTLEAEITGGLEHPGIVPVYGLGQYGDGRPFYAMRFVKGDSLREAINKFHTDSDQMDAGERSLHLRKLLGRFIDVCNAIEYAHSRGVLHRDLKPGNVMLGKYGETLVVDWGLAKAAGRSDKYERSEEPTLKPNSGSGPGPTQMGAAIGTPAYMSPEQASGRLDELGAHSDVYSLGATLYDLLTGTAPFKGRVPEVLQAVRQGDFPRPRQVDSTISKSLEAICLKAMNREPPDRYETPGDLANEIERWLADEPVKSYRDPIFLRIRRWTKRHQRFVTGTVATTLVSVVSLIVGISLLAAANERESEARQLAQERFDLALAAVEKYYTGASEDVLLKQENLKELREDLLRTGLDFYKQLEKKLKGSTDLGSRVALARAYTAIGDITWLVGNQEQAKEAYRQALRIQGKLAAENPTVSEHQAVLAACYNNIGVLQRATGNTDSALKSYQQALQIRAKLAEKHPAVAEYQSELAISHNTIGNLQRDKDSTGAALKSYEQALQVQEKLAAENPTATEFHSDLALSHNNIGVLHRDTGDAEKALKSYGRALLIRQQLANENPTVTEFRGDLAASHNLIGHLRYDTGDIDAALKSYQRALQILEELTKENPTMTQYQMDRAASHYNIGTVHSLAGDNDAALNSHQQALKIRKKLAEENPTVTQYQMNRAASHNNIGLLQRVMGDIDAALNSHLEALRIQDKMSEENPDVTRFQSDQAASHNNIGVLQRVAGDTAAALNSHQQALKIRKKLAEENPTVTLYQIDEAASHNNIGLLQRATGDTGAALRSYQQALQIQEKLSEEDPTITRYQSDQAASHNNMGNLYRVTGNLNAALNSYQQSRKIFEQLATGNPTIVQYQRYLAKIQNNIAVLLRTSGDADGALRSYSHGIEVFSQLVKKVGNSSAAAGFLVQMLRVRANLWTDLKQYEKAAEDWDRVIAICPAPERPGHAIRSARLRAISGNHEQATQVVGELVNGKAVSAAMFYNAACVFSLSSKAAKGNEQLPAEQRAAVTESHARTAIQLLVEAREAGFFEAPTNLDHLGKDADLDAIREHAAFRELLEQLKASADND